MKKIMFLFVCFLSLMTIRAQTDSTQRIEVMPEFPGGELGMNRFLDSIMTYPSMAREQGIQGKVWIGFIVQKDGKVTDVEILRGIGGGCDEEAKRVVEKMPDWKPGTVNGEPVVVKFRFPVNFILKDEGKSKKKKNKK